VAPAETREPTLKVHQRRKVLSTSLALLLPPPSPFLPVALLRFFSSLFVLFAHRRAPILPSLYLLSGLTSLVVPIMHASLEPLILPSLVLPRILSCLLAEGSETQLGRERERIIIFLYILVPCPAVSFLFLIL
jgi:hypothetical protein